jgi:hypothetical protein
MCSREWQAMHMHTNPWKLDKRTIQTLYLLLTIEIIDKWLQPQSENIEHRRSRILSLATTQSGEDWTYQPRCFPTKNDFGAIINPAQSICPDLFPNLLAFLFILPSSPWSCWIDSRQTFRGIERGSVGLNGSPRMSLGVLSY